MDASGRVAFCSWLPANGDTLSQISCEISEYFGTCCIIYNYILTVLKGLRQRSVEHVRVLSIKLIFERLPSRFPVTSSISCEQCLWVRGENDSLSVALLDYLHKISLLPNVVCNLCQIQDRFPLKFKHRFKLIEFQAPTNWLGLSSDENILKHHGMMPSAVSIFQKQLTNMRTV